MDPIDLDAIEAACRGFFLPDHYAWRLIRAVRERDTEIARLCALPGADAHERAEQFVAKLKPYVANTPIFTEHLARVVQQYGDERAAAAREAWLPNTAEPTDPETGTPLDREPAMWLRDRWIYTQQSALDAIAVAREAAIEEVVCWIEKHVTAPRLGELPAALRALAAKPRIQEG